jgi:DNA (cytosine-5)-methyltransferase 1
MELDGVLSDLEGAGYETATFVIPAVAVDAKHRRDRVFVVAHAKHNGWAGGEVAGGIGTRTGTSSGSLGTEQPAGSGGSQERCQNVADTASIGQSGSWSRRDASSGAQTGHGETVEFVAEREPAVWLPEPDVGRVASGVPNRVDRLKCLGNAVVPQVAYAIGTIIKQYVDTKGARG